MFTSRQYHVFPMEGGGVSSNTLHISVQAEIFLLPDPTFLEGFYLNFHMPGHFFLYEVVYAYPSGPLARLHKNRTKRL